MTSFPRQRKSITKTIGRQKLLSLVLMLNIDKFLHIRAPLISTEFKFCDVRAILAITRKRLRWKSFLSEKDVFSILAIKTRLELQHLNQSNLDNSYPAPKLNIDRFVLPRFPQLQPEPSVRLKSTNRHRLLPTLNFGLHFWQATDVRAIIVITKMHSAWRALVALQ